MIEGSITGEYPHHLRPDRAGPRLRRDPHGDPRRAHGAKRRPRLADQRREDVDDRHARRHSLRALRPHLGEGRRRPRHHLLSRAGRPRGRQVEEYLWTFNMPTDHPRVGFTDVFVAEDALFGELGKGLSAGAVLRAPEPHPPGGELARRGGLLHQRERRLRASPQAVRAGARRQPGHPVAAGRARHPGRDAAAPHPQDRLGNGPGDARGD